MDPMPLAGTWRDEEWARHVARLGKAERARRINAVTVLLDAVDGISDPLESELQVLLDAPAGRGPSRADRKGGPQTWSTLPVAILDLSRTQGSFAGGSPSAMSAAAAAPMAIAMDVIMAA